MVRFFLKLIVSVALLAIMVGSNVDTAFALNLVSPTEGQIVRESVKIVIPVSELPSDFVVKKGEKSLDKGRPFVSVMINSGDNEQLVSANASDSVMVKNGMAIFYWNTKTPYRELKAPDKDQYFKDGEYKLKIQVHDGNSKVIDSANVSVVLRNKIARSNPAPAVTLVNRLQFGDTSGYRVRSDVQVFEVVNGVGLPILGGLGIAGDFKIIQSVEDVQPGGQFMVRNRIDKGAWISSFGKRTELYAAEESRPQLYRLVTKYGNVVKANVFSRQGKYTIMDILPVLPNQPVKEGDSWPSKCTLKIEGITNLITFSGISMLDGFEWENGRECAKIISRMSGSSQISLNGGKIKSEGSKVDALVTTYFAHKTGKMMKRTITLKFPATILPGANDPSTDNNSDIQVNEISQPMTGDMPFDDEAALFGNRGMSRKQNTQVDSGGKKGSVIISVTVKLES